jgi:hypothetical protein
MSGGTGIIIMRRKNKTERKAIKEKGGKEIKIQKE